MHRNCIPKSTKDSDLESSFVDILKKIGITVNPITDIQACHRIGNRGTVIVKRTNRTSPLISINILLICRKSH